MLPISVLIPTRNSMALLPQHLDSMRPWMNRVAEFIVVDSQSRDGTWELLKSRLPADRTRFFQHPPGLYESWNFGIRQARENYLYVSTVGDKISLEGLTHLFETIISLGCDVVVSPPDFVNEREQRVYSNPWPVHRLISFFELSQPICLEGLIPFACAISYIPFAILGSAASNLYRTDVLQDHPFPTEYGPNGDGAWGVFHSLNIRFGITPRCVSFFKKHERPYRIKDRGLDPEERMFNKGVKIWEAMCSTDPHLAAEADRLGLEKLIATKRLSQEWRARLLRERSRRVPWFVNPIAWHARMHRDFEQRRCDALRNELLKMSVVNNSASVLFTPETASI